MLPIALVFVTVIGLLVISKYVSSAQPDQLSNDLGLPSLSEILSLIQFLKRTNQTDGVVVELTVEDSQPSSLTIKSIVGIIFSFMVLFASLYVILSNDYPEADKKWAYGSVGTILGYWIG